MKTKDTNTDIDIEPAEEVVVNEALKDVADAMSSPNAYKHLMASDFASMPLQPKMQLFARLHQLLSFSAELIGADVHSLQRWHVEHIASNRPRLESESIPSHQKIAIDALENIKQVLNRLASWDFEAMAYRPLMQTFGRIERIIDVATTRLEDEWKRNDNRTDNDKPHTTVSDHPFMTIHTEEEE